MTLVGIEPGIQICPWVPRVLPKRLSHYAILWKTIFCRYLVDNKSYPNYFFSVCVEWWELSNELCLSLWGLLVVEISKILILAPKTGFCARARQQSWKSKIEEKSPPGNWKSFRMSHRSTSHLTWSQRNLGTIFPEGRTKKKQKKTQFHSPFNIIYIYIYI